MAIALPMCPRHCGCPWHLPAVASGGSPCPASPAQGVPKDQRCSSQPQAPRIRAGARAALCQHGTGYALGKGNRPWMSPSAMSSRATAAASSPTHPARPPWEKTPRYLGNFGKFEARTTSGISKLRQAAEGDGAAVIDPSVGHQPRSPAGSQQGPAGAAQPGEEEEDISDRNLPALTLTKSKFPSQGHGQNQELCGWNGENQLSPWRRVG